ncbi:MAG TPA: transposase [Ancylobacter sp.]
MQLIDSSIIRAPQHATSGKKGPDIVIGRSRGGASTKINAAVDQAGMPIRIVLSQRRSSDKTIAPVMLEALAPDRDLSRTKAATTLRDHRSGRKPRRPDLLPDLPQWQGPTVVDPVFDGRRHLIERFLSKLKRFRRIALRARRPETYSHQPRSPQPVDGYGLSRQRAARSQDVS